jgi:DNA-binding MarR family transcriptional regulator
MAKKQKAEIPFVHKNILNIYKVFTMVNGYQPSYVQVGQVLNISGAAVGNHIRHMERAGLVRRPPEKWGRGLTLLR